MKEGVVFRHIPEIRVRTDEPIIRISQDAKKRGNRVFLLNGLCPSMTMVLDRTGQSAEDRNSSILGDMNESQHEYPHILFVNDNVISSLVIMIRRKRCYMLQKLEGK
jgi:hypothetical protein